jgi:hypothetical protein
LTAFIYVPKFGAVENNATCRVDERLLPFFSMSIRKNDEFKRFLKEALWI